MPSKSCYLSDDLKFEELFPLDIRKSAGRHWTSFEVVDLAIKFLTDNGGKILDIGSGIGKFCLAGAYYAPYAQFYGIEQRPHLVEHAIDAQMRLGIDNVHFIKGNFTQLDLREFDHFYFFNSFFENLDYESPIDDSIDQSPALFNYYNHYLFTGLQKMPKGTKVVTYHSVLEEIPDSYELVESCGNSELNFWIKQL